MAIYLGLIFLCTFFSFAVNTYRKMSVTTKKILNYRYLNIVPFILLFCVSAFRYKVGMDYGIYVSAYEAIKNGFSVRTDIFSRLLFRFMSVFQLSPQWYFIITSFLMNLFIYIVINSESENIPLSYYIFLCGTMYFASMNTVRQFMAIALFYMSLKYVGESSFKKYFICNAIGALFHASALFLIPLYFILKWRGGKKYWICIILIFLFRSQITAILETLIINTKYSMYLTYSTFANDAWEGWKISNYINAILFALYYFVLKNKDDKDYTYMNIHFLGIIVSLIALSFPGGDRIFMYFRFVEFLSVPNLISHLRLNKNQKIVIIILIMMIYFIYFYHTIIILNGNNVLPYVSVFSRGE